MLDPLTHHAFVDLLHSYPQLLYHRVDSIRRIIRRFGFLGSVPGIPFLIAFPSELLKQFGYLANNRGARAVCILVSLIIWVVYFGKACCFCDTASASSAFLILNSGMLIDGRFRCHALAL